LCSQIQPLEALDLICGTNSIKTLALQLLNNDIHAAHEFILMNAEKLANILNSSIIHVGSDKSLNLLPEPPRALNIRQDDVYYGERHLEEPSQTICDPESLTSSNSNFESCCGSSEQSQILHPDISAIKRPPPPPPPPPPLLYNESSLSDLTQSRLRVKQALGMEDIKSVQGTVWAEQCIEEEFDTKVFEEMFCIDSSSEVNHTRKIQSRCSFNSSQKSNCPALIELRRANNIGIGLSRIGRNLSFSDLRTKIVERNPLFDLDGLLILREILPTQEETALLKIFDGLPESLTLTEQFLFEMSREIGISWMVDCLILEHCFELEVTKAVEQLQCASSILRKLCESPSLKRILRIVLDLGNLTNYIYGRSTRRRKARGIRLSSLGSLKAVYSLDRDFNLLHYLVVTLKDKYPECLSISEEFTELNEGITFDAMAALDLINELQSKLNNVRFYRTVRNTHNLTKFRDGMASFLVRSEKIMACAIQEAELFSKSWIQSVEYFGEKQDEIRPNDMFSYLYEFFKDLDRARSQLAAVAPNAPILRSQSSFNSLTDESGKAGQSLSPDDM
jgi:formic-like protein